MNGINELKENDKNTCCPALLLLSCSSNLYLSLFIHMINQYACKYNIKLF